MFIMGAVLVDPTFNHCWVGFVDLRDQRVKNWKTFRWFCKMKDNKLVC